MSKDSSSEGKSQDASTPDAPADAPAKDSNADLYENRGQKKLIRVVTVMAYLFSVSFVGILLSAYYIFLWEPPNPRLVQRERLRADPQMQFLIASPAEETTEDSSFLLQTEVKPFLSPRIMNDNDDSAVDPQVKINLEKKRRLNALLLKLWHSLVDAGRAQKRNSSQVTTNAGEFNNSFVEKELNSMLDRAENTISRYGESRGNTLEEKTYSDNADVPVELADSASTLDVESTSSTSRLTTIPETSQTRHDRDSIANVNPIIEKKKQYNRKKFDAVSSYLIRGLSYATTNSDITIGSDRRVSGDDDSSKVTRGFLRTDRKESMKQNETDDRRLINSNRENDSDDVQTNVILKECVNCNVRNSRENYSNESSSNNQVRQIARDGVSIDPPPSRDSGFTDDPGFQQTPDDLTVVKSRITTGTRNSEETQIERMTARSTTTDNKQLEQIDLSTTQRQKSIPEVFTEIADVEETSVEPTSISTARDYHNITSITSEDDESVT